MTIENNSTGKNKVRIVKRIKNFEGFIKYDKKTETAKHHTINPFYDSNTKFSKKL